MNEEAFNTMYTLAQKEGYKKTPEEFKTLLSSNEEALNTMYSLAQKEGYEKPVDEFKTLLGVSSVEGENVNFTNASSEPSEGATREQSQGGTPSPSQPLQPSEESGTKPSVLVEQPLPVGVAAPQEQDNVAVTSDGNYKVDVSGTILFPKDGGELKPTTFTELLQISGGDKDAAIRMFANRSELDKVVDSPSKKRVSEMLQEPVPTEEEMRTEIEQEFAVKYSAGGLYNDYINKNTTLDSIYSEIDRLENLDTPPQEQIKKLKTETTSLRGQVSDAADNIVKPVLSKNLNKYFNEDRTVKDEWITENFYGIPVVDNDKIRESLPKNTDEFIVDENLRTKYLSDLSKIIQGRIDAPEASREEERDKIYTEKYGQSFEEQVDADAKKAFEDRYGDALKNISESYIAKVDSVDTEITTDYQNYSNALKTEFDKISNDYNSQIASIQERAKSVTSEEDLKVLQSEADRLTSDYNKKVDAFTRQDAEYIADANRRANELNKKFYSESQQQTNALSKEFSETYKVPENLLNNYQEAYSIGTNKLLGKANKAKKTIIQYETDIPFGRVATGTIGALSGSLYAITKSMGGEFPELKKIEQYFQPGVDPIKGFSDLNLYNIQESAGQLAGSMTPSIAASIATAVATKNLSTAARMYSVAAAGFTTESLDLSGRAYQTALEETGSTAIAENAAKETIDSQLLLAPTYLLSSLPFIGGLSKIANRPLRMLAGGTVEFGTEGLLQELPQQISEESIQKYGEFERALEFLTPQKTEEVLANVAPTFLLGAAGSFNADPANKLNNVIDRYPELARQHLIDFTYKNGKEKSALYLATLHSNGGINTATAENLYQFVESIDLDNTQEYTALKAKRDDLAALQEAQKDEIKKKVIDKQIAEIDTQLENILEGKETNVTQTTVGGSDYFVTASEVENTDKQQDLEDVQKSIDEAEGKPVEEAPEPVTAESKPKYDKPRMFTTTTPERFGAVNRQDGKGEVVLTEEEYKAEMEKFAPVEEVPLVTDEAGEVITVYRGGKPTSGVQYYTDDADLAQGIGESKGEGVQKATVRMANPWTPESLDVNNAPQWMQDWVRSQEEFTTVDEETMAAEEIPMEQAIQEIKDMQLSFRDVGLWQSFVNEALEHHDGIIAFDPSEDMAADKKIYITKSPEQVVTEEAPIVTEEVTEETTKEGKVYNVLNEKQKEAYLKLSEEEKKVVDEIIFDEEYEKSIGAVENIENKEELEDVINKSAISFNDMLNNALGLNIQNQKADGELFVFGQETYNIDGAVNLASEENIETIDIGVETLPKLRYSFVQKTDEGVQNADISKPVIIATTKDGLLLIDGHHRVEKAIKENKPLKAIVLSESQTKSIKVTEETTKEGKEEVREQAAPEDKVGAAKQNLQDAWTKWKDQQRNVGIAFDPRSRAEEDVVLTRAVIDYLKAIGAKTIEDVKAAVKNLSGFTVNQEDAKYLLGSARMENIREKIEEGITNQEPYANIEKALVADGYNAEEVKKRYNAKLREKAPINQRLQEYEESFDEARKTTRDKGKLPDRIKKGLTDFVSAVFDPKIKAKRVFRRLDMQSVLDRLQSLYGTSGTANFRFSKAYDKIYKGLSVNDTKILDQLIQLRRFVAIDKDRASKGLPKPDHSDFRTGEEAQELITAIQDKIGQAKFLDLSLRADAYFNEFRKTLDKFQEAGLISKELRDELYEIDYQPRRFLEFLVDADKRAMSSEERRFNTGVRQEVIKKLGTGDDSQLFNNSEWLLSTAINQAETAIAYNKFGRNLAKELSKLKDKYDAARKKTKKNRADKKLIETYNQINELFINNPVVKIDNGKPVYKFDKPLKGFSVFRYKENGVENQIFIKDDVYESLTGVGNIAIDPKVLDIIALLTGAKLLQSSATGVNPGFVLGNLPRDFGFALTFEDAYSNVLPIAMKELGVDMVNAWASIQTEDQTFIDFVEHGGMMDYMYTMGALDEKSITDKFFDRAFGLFSDEKIGKENKEAFGDAVTYLNKMSELGIRVGVYSRVFNQEMEKINKQSFDSPQERQDAIENAKYHAVARARNLIDFTQGGSVIKTLNKIFPYMNAAFQATYSAGNAIYKNPVRATSIIAQSAGGMTAFFAGSSLALISALRGDDDEDKTSGQIYYETLDNISPYTKKKYFVIPTGVKDEKGNYGYIKIAKTQNLTPFFLTAEYYINKVGREIAGVEPEDEKVFLKNLAETVADDVDPTGSFNPNNFKGGVGQFLMPLANKNPGLSAVVVLTTGYDPYRKKSVDSYEGFPELSGYDNPKIEDFYKDLGEITGDSPARLKVATEKIITNPSTNPFVGGFYSMLDVVAGNKDAKEMLTAPAEGFVKSLKGRAFGTTSPYVKNFERDEVLKEKVKEIAKEEQKIDIARDNLIQKYVDGEIKKSDLKKQAIELSKEVDVENQKSFIESIEKRVNNPNVPPVYFSVAYGELYKGSPEKQALKIVDHFGADILQNADNYYEMKSNFDKIGFKISNELKLEILRIVDQKGADELIKNLTEPPKKKKRIFVGRAI